MFRAEHAQLVRTAYFLSKTPEMRVRKRCSTLKIEARCIAVTYIYTYIFFIYEITYIYLAGQLRVEQFLTMLVEGLDRVHLLR